MEGPHAVGDALRAGVVKRVYATEDGVTSVAIPPATPLTMVDGHVLERMATTTTPQGVLAVARSTTARLEDVVGEGLLVVLHGVADPGNAGVIVRTADAAGAAGVVFTAGSVDPFSPKAVRAAAGSTYHLGLVVDVRLEEVAAATARAGQRLLALDAGGRTSVFSLSSASRPVALLLGNEAHGLGDDVAGLVDGVVAVPIHGRSESLNVASAAAVAIYAAAQGLHRSG